MNSYIKYSIKNPVVVLVCVIFALLFGFLALKKMPYQLLPLVARPNISIYTTWSGASPYEVEKQITERQEKYLKNLNGLLSMNSTSREGSSIINMEFDAHTDLKTTLLDISSKLDEVRGYPTDVSKPIIRTTGENVPISIYLFVKSLGFKDVNTEKNFILNEVVKYFERIPGVGEVYTSGGVSEKIYIDLDLEKILFFQVNLEEILSSMRNQNINISAGSLDFEQRNYRITALGEYSQLEDIGKTVIKTLGNTTVLLRDVSSIGYGYEKTTSYNFHNLSPTISIQIRPTPFANILDLTNRVEEMTSFLNTHFLSKRGIYIDWGRDQRSYIKSSIKQVKNSFLIGIFLAIILILCFLRNLATLLLILFSIPLSIMSSFIILHWLDRTFNVILLAGISFAASMIVDSCIVVLQNILRHTKLQKDLFSASFKGTKEVSGALFASGITTIGIFLPIIFLQDEASKLFVDIALSSSIILVISFLFSIFVIPSFFYAALKFPIFKQSQTKNSLEIFFENLGNFLSLKIMQIVEICTKNKIIQILVVLLFTGSSLVFSYIFFPKMDYLPKGNQNFLTAYLSIPNGLSLQEKQRIIDTLRKDFEPLLSKYRQDETQISPSSSTPLKDIPLIKNFFISASDSIYFYLIAEDDKKVRELAKYAQEKINSIPNVSGVVLQQEIFSRISSSSIDINITGYNLESLSQIASNLLESIQSKLPFVNVRVVPSLEANNQEINLYPNSELLALNGMNVSSFGDTIDVLLEGKKVGEWRNKNNGDLLDITLGTRREENLITSPEDILYTQIYTPSGRILPLGSLVDVKYEYGVSRIRHFNQNRSLLLILNIRDNTPIEEVVQRLQTEVIAPQVIGEENAIILGGSALKLKVLKKQLIEGFCLAVIITYLILSALYGNFLYPFIIIFTVPFALAGGIAGVVLVDKFIAPQNLDILTMFGFIILIGSVVNNAILIVYQSLIHIQVHHKPPRESIIEATRMRLSPIYMSMLTSVLALSPLVLFAGDGSEIYRGLGAVLVGGILFSTLISVFLIPSLLMFFFEKPEKKLKAGK